MTRLRAAIVIDILVLLTVGAEASPILYNSESAFAAAAGGGLSVESFETPGPNGASLSLAGFTATESGGVNFLSFYPDFLLTANGLSNANTDGSYAIAFTDNGSSVVTFQFVSPIRAFGVFFTPQTATTMTMNLASDSLSVGLTTNSPQFFGAVDSTGTFQTITFDASGSPGLAFDEVRFAAVAEPISLLLLGTGLIGAGVRRYRQRR